MDFLDMVKKRRSIRQFKDREVSKEDLVSLVDTAHYAPSYANLQLVRYLLVHSPNKVLDLSQNSLLSLPGLSLKESASIPGAYIALLAPKGVSKNIYFEAGAIFQNIAHHALDLSLGSCWLQTYAEGKIRDILALEDEQELLGLIALGYPAENPIAENTTVSLTFEDLKVGSKNYARVPKMNSKYLISWL